MKRRTISIALVYCVGIALGQTGNSKRALTPAEQSAVIEKVREQALRYTKQLPNYICTQRTLQVIRQGMDRIEEQVSFVDNRETRRVVSLNGHPVAADSPDQQRGTPSRGEFGSLLESIFDPRTDANLEWKRQATLDHRRVYVFAYRVPQSKGYTLIDSKRTIQVPYHGFVYANAETLGVVRIEMNILAADIPKGSEYVNADLTLDYKPEQVAGQEFILPAQYILRYQMRGGLATSVASYTNYRKFSADATIQFERNSGATGRGDAEPAAAPPRAPAPEAAAAVTEIPRAAPAELPPAPPAPTAVPVAELKAPLPDQPAAATPPALAPAPAPVFRTATQLVQVSVIAQDKDGKPVTDLRRDDFQIFDNAAPQEIRLFRADLPSASAPAPQPPGAFTNRLGSGGSSVLLFDKLFIDSENQVFAANVHARQKALQAMNALPPGERIAIYALWCRFQVVREFTSDRDSLLEKLNAFSPAAAPCVDGAIPGNEVRLPDPRQSEVAETMKAHEQENFAAIAGRRKLELGNFEFQAMADHLAGIPGRKNLIWVTSEFNLSAANLKRLVDANVAIYPVDAIGMMALASPSQKKARHDLLLSFAAPSGGLVFFDRDDFEAGIRDAVRDGLVSYTLGFYPASEDTKAPAHQLGVRVSRPGVTLRYRTSYELKPPPAPSANAVADLVEALNRPVDATVIPITANATRDGDQVDVSVSIDAPSLDLELSDGLWKGQAELVLRFVTADGLPAGDASAQTLTFSFRPATYESMLKGGDPYRSQSELPIPPKATELKVLIGKLASGKIGTLTIPLSEVPPSPANPK